MALDTTTMRLVAQVALVSWCVGEIVVLLLLRGKWVRLVGIQWAIGGLTCFALWMLISALSIRDVAFFPRSLAVGPLALLEMGTAFCAWAHWIALTRRTFHIAWHRTAIPEESST